ncbi:hypothetical protein GGE65_007725 [Skermanella aerolata]|uniref:DUF5309 domain-containing protein n=1 Tax=Skermanella aerolata TaxID=393310 RepID=UPI003D239240
MAQPTNVFSAYQAKGIREDLSNIISRIDPDEVPFTSNIGKTKAKQQYHEWQTQSLAAASDSNAAVDGDDATAQAAVPTVRLGNRTQISTKTAAVTGRLEAVDKAGRDSEMDYQVLLKGLELRRDVEKQMMSNKPSIVGNDTTPSQSAGFEAFLTTNVNRGVGGASGGFSNGNVTAATDGTARAFAEAQIKDVQQKAYTAGGHPSLLFLGPSQKAAFSSFSGIAANRIDYGPDATQVRIVAGADVYAGDFGKLTAIASIFSRNRSALLVDPKLVKQAILRPLRETALGKTGDSTKKQLLIEYSLEVTNEAGHGIVADLT